MYVYVVELVFLHTWFGRCMFMWLSWCFCTHGLVGVCLCGWVGVFVFLCSFDV